VIARYRTLLAIPGFRRLLIGAVLARMPSGMFSLAILLFVHARTGSFLDAGVAVGAFTLAGAAAGPALGALVDRIGQTHVLVPVAVGQTAALAALALLVGAGTPMVATVALAALAGSLQPPIAGCIRALWAVVSGGGEELEIAYALDATTQEVIWTLGPLLVGFTAVLASAAVAVLLCAAFTLLGTLFFAASKISHDWRASTAAHTRGGALSSGGLRSLLATVALAGVVIGAVEIGLPALAAERGARWASGPLLALFSIGSMAGGMLYSARSWRGAVGARYCALMLAMAFAVAPLVAVRSLTLAFPLAALAGLGLAPMLCAQLSLVGSLAPADSATEAFTWHRAATIGGMAVGSSLGGSLIQAHGSAAAFALGCTGITLAWFLAELWRTRIEQLPAAGLSEPRSG
jgi:hypothetical protein